MKEEEVYTAYRYLVNKVKYEIPKDALLAIMADRDIEPDLAYVYADKNVLRLAYADMLKWFILGPSKVNNTSDSDNGWTHAGGGYDMSDADRNELRAEANAIYEELEPASQMKKKASFRMMSQGVQRANYTPWGEPIPHIIK